MSDNRFPPTRERRKETGTQKTLPKATRADAAEGVWLKTPSFVRFKQKREAAEKVSPFSSGILVVSFKLCLMKAHSTAHLMLFFAQNRIATRKAKPFIARSSATSGQQHAIRLSRTANRLFCDRNNFGTRRFVDKLLRI